MMKPQPPIDHDYLTHATLNWLRLRSWQIRWCSEATISASCRVDALAIHIPTREWRKRLGLPLSDAATRLSVVFESKASRSDFLCTFGSKAVRPRGVIANFHFVVTPSQLVRAEECPNPWGLLEARGHNGFRIIKLPQFCEIERAKLLELSEILLWKREPWWRQDAAESVEVTEDAEQI